MSNRAGKRVEALDFLIKVLKEHEKRLDAITERLETIATLLETKSVTDKSDRAQMTECKDWEDFKEVSKEADKVSFYINDKNLTIYSSVGGKAYWYNETFQDNQVQLNCGLKFWVTNMLFRIDKNEVKRWICRELGVPEENVEEGK